jgi:hypothetical protein
VKTKRPRQFKQPYTLPHLCCPRLPHFFTLCQCSQGCCQLQFSGLVGNSQGLVVVEEKNIIIIIIMIIKREGGDKRAFPWSEEM